MLNYSELLSDIILSKKSEATKEFVPSKFYNLDFGIRRERFDIETPVQEKYYGKEIGRYELISLKDVLLMQKKETEFATTLLTKILKSMIGKLSGSDSVLIIGLGNRHISSDSLGSKVLSKINISFGSRSCPKVMAICPSVLGLTGIETYDIISGVVSKTDPTHIIIIDSLCASNVSRLGSSLQITNSGICPGSGVGNKRKCIDKSLCENIYSIGVPLLIYASTFISSTFNNLDINSSQIDDIINKCKKVDTEGEILDFVNRVKKTYKSSLDDIIVSIKDIEECVVILAEIIADAINHVTGLI